MDEQQVDEWENDETRSDDREPEHAPRHERNDFMRRKPHAAVLVLIGGVVVLGGAVATFASPGSNSPSATHIIGGIPTPVLADADSIATSTFNSNNAVGTPDGFTSADDTIPADTTTVPDGTTPGTSPRTTQKPHGTTTTVTSPPPPGTTTTTAPPPGTTTTTKKPRNTTTTKKPHHTTTTKKITNS